MSFGQCRLVLVLRPLQHQTERQNKIMHESVTLISNMQLIYWYPCTALGINTKNIDIEALTLQ